MSAEYVVAYLEFMNADSEDYGATNIQEIFGSVEVGYDHVVTERFVYVFGDETAHGGFKGARTS